MTIVNDAGVNEQRVNDMRSAIEHRATWLYLLLDEAEKAGLPWEEFGRKAITRCGVFHGSTKFTKTEDLQAFAREFGNELYTKIFEMDVKEATAERFEVHFHYCPLVAAWLRQTKDEKKIETLCDITMDGDRGIISAFPHLEFDLGETIAQGGKVCKIVITKVKAARQSRML
ncbi:MAG TPA: L-2-amino-thiazoline-4-carboxylic acid hydrolase [Candidatus Methylomirabilis sp.]|nr:L-2-amino-thiazoline-4-carboxylic acid hydrolase [Candidatus Methylomirabilis sp.]